MSRFWKILFSLSYVAPVLALWAEYQYRRMQVLPVPAVRSQLPPLSIIIPARDEEENLQRLLPSLNAIDYDGSYEIIVVDDGSSDRSAEVARSLGVQVVPIEELPPGWKGKPFACTVGADCAQGEWLLFTDADTLHAEYGPASAVAYAIANEIDGLSLFPAQETAGLLDTVGLMVAFAGLFSGLNWAHTTLNGQFILLRRDVYIESGGFAAVRDFAVEDLAMGRHLHRRGYRVPIMRGEGVVTVQMYRSFSSLWHGLNRLGADSLKFSGKGALTAVFLITATMTPFLTIPAVLIKRLSLTWTPLMWLAAMLGFVPWARRFGSAGWAVLAPVGAFFVQITSTFGLLKRLFGRGIQWKGRMV